MHTNEIIQCFPTLVDLAERFTCDVCDKMFLNKVDADLCYKNNLDMRTQPLPRVPGSSENITCRN
ncbi:hypothetical protein E2C01_014837 [Portunus trituberculatus]|uniref:Uncharacterized protein n=1 Tax=Portunus trituberculatus TaxID=210409 RepID=A0A5B7DLH7_PORTR|nr:hypothetical protein [Portunus trituberculatus]